MIYWRHGCINNKFTLGAIIPGIVSSYIYSASFSSALPFKEQKTSLISFLFIQIFGMNYKPIKQHPVPDVGEDDSERVTCVDGLKSILSFTFIFIFLYFVFCFVLK